MRTFLSLVLSAFVLALLVPADASAERDHSLKYLAVVAQQFDVPHQDLADILRPGVTEENLPVVCLVAQKAKTSPTEVAKMRGSLKSWMEITSHYGLDASIFNYVVAGDNWTTLGGTCYETSLGKFHNKPKEEWAKVKLTDKEVVDLVNLRMIAERYQTSPFSTMRARHNGADFASICAGVAREVSKKEAHRMASRSNR